MQTLDEFLDFESRLTANLEAHEDVLGLVFVGSAADHSRFDEWSDHDFFVITREGAGESLRQDLSWLPDAGQIALQPRETAHGLKVVYESGHVLEFAVFNDSELELAGANAFLVTLDKSGNINDRMTALANKSAVTAKYYPDAQFELFLCQLLIGVGRARRGEMLIAGEHVRSWAVAGLVGLARHWLPVAEGTEQLADNLAVLRRFERQYPSLGAAIAAAQATSVEESAKGLLEIATSAFAAQLTQSQLDQATVVARRLGWV